MAAVGTGISFFLFRHPLFSADFTTFRDRAQNYLLAHRNREIVYKFAGKISAFVTPLYLLVAAARFNRADLAISKNAIGQASVANQVFRLDPVNRRKFLLEFFVTVPPSDMDTAHSAIQSAWGCKLFVHWQSTSFPFVFTIICLANIAYKKDVSHPPAGFVDAISVM
jgi:hypothetical protein